jgi:DNA-binding protein Fis
MNFPEVPFDENLFASNTMLKSYWERSTNERPGATIPDWPSEESPESSDAQELRQATKEQFSESEEQYSKDSISQEPQDVFGIVLPEVEKKISDDLVLPKMSGTNITIIVIASVVALGFFLYLFSHSGKNYFRRT